MLKQAIDEDRADIVETLLDQGPEFNAEIPWSPLVYAVDRSSPNLAITKMLAKEDVSSRRHLAPTPLQIACQRDNIDVIRLLVEYGAFTGSPKGSGTLTAPYVGRHVW